MLTHAICCSFACRHLQTYSCHEIDQQSENCWWCSAPRPACFSLPVMNQTDLEYVIHYIILSPIHVDWEKTQSLFHTSKFHSQVSTSSTQVSSTQVNFTQNWSQPKSCTWLSLPKSLTTLDSSLMKILKYWKLPWFITLNLSLFKTIQQEKGKILVPKIILRFKNI